MQIRPFIPHMATVLLLLVLGSSPVQSQIFPELEWSASLHEDGYWMDLREAFELSNGNLLFTGSHYYTDNYGYGHTQYGMEILCWEVTPTGQPVIHDYGDWGWRLWYRDADITDEDNVLVAGEHEYRGYDEEATTTLVEWDGQSVNRVWEVDAPGDYEPGYDMPRILRMAVSPAESAPDTLITIWRSVFGDWYDLDWYTCVEYRMDYGGYYQLSLLSEQNPRDTWIDANSQPVLLYTGYDGDVDEWYYALHRYTQSGDPYPVQQFAVPFEPHGYKDFIQPLRDPSFVLTARGQPDVDSTFIARHSDDGTRLWQTTIPGDCERVLDYGPDHLLAVLDDGQGAVVLNIHDGQNVASAPWNAGDLTVRSFSVLENWDILVVGGHQIELPYDQASWDAEVRYFRNPLVNGSVADEQIGTPTSFHLSAAYPNPFNPATSFTVDLPTPSPLAVTVFDLLGRPVSILYNEPAAPGSHRFTFNATGLPSGTYLLRAQAGSEVQTQRITLLQ